MLAVSLFFSGISRPQGETANAATDRRLIALVGLWTLGRCHLSLSALSAFFLQLRGMPIR